MKFVQKVKKCVVMALTFALLLQLSACALKGTAEGDRMQPQTDSVSGPPTAEQSKEAQEEEPVENFLAPTVESELQLSLDSTELSYEEYSGEPYAIINDNIPCFTPEEITSESFEFYSDLDSLGRCGVAFSSVGRDTMPTEARGEIGQVKPSGWHTVRYDDIIDGNYLYNRCHLLGYQLTAENANERNLITGTRYLNVQGMLPFENMVADYITETDNHVLYRVTPIYSGENLVANGVQMEALSVEDDGAGIKFNVFCYNVQPGVYIDYSTGESHLEGDSSIHEDTNTSSPIDEEDMQGNNSVSVKTDAGNETYVLNTNTKKFHYPDCASVKTMSEANKKTVNTTRQEVIDEGYIACKKCCP